MISNKKLILIDIDDTLLDFDLSAHSAILAAASEYGLEGTEELLSAFDRINPTLWESVEKKEITKKRLFEIRWDTVFGELNGCFPRGTDFENAFKLALRTAAVPIEGAAELLGYLSSKYTLCVASNSTLLQQETRLKAAGMRHFFDKIFVSDLIGAEKPSREFFDYCFAGLESITPEESVMIGDSLSADIAGGNRYGMTTVFIDRGKPNRHPEIIPDFTVTALSEIKKLL